jgi:hypothetical protein
MALTDTQQTMDAYIRDLLNRGDYSRHYSEDVEVEVRGTDQRYRGREATKNWVEGIHAVGEIKVRNTYIGETHAVAEAELVRKDGIPVPYSVITTWPLARSPHCGSTSLAPFSRSCRHACSPPSS